MKMVAPFLIIYTMLVGVSGQEDDGAIGNLTALLGDPEVHKFVDDVIEANPITPSNARSLVEQLDGDTLRKSDPYRLCDKCVEAFSSSMTNFFVQQIRKACRGRLASHTAERFCEYLEERIASLDQFFNGYLFHRSRSRQLSIATCIEDKKCSPKKAFNSFFNPIIPARLVNFTKFRYCPRVSYRSVSRCTNDVLPRMERFAARRVSRRCSAKRTKGDLQEFCDYYMIDKRFGRGLVASFADIFGYAIGYCVRDQCC